MATLTKLSEPTATPRPPGRIALFLVLTALALILSAIAFVLVNRFQTGVILLEAPVDPDHPRAAYNPMQQLRLMMALLLVATFGIIAFLVGAYLVIRYGRALTARKVGGTQTEYVDAWAKAHVSDEDVEDIERQWGENDGRSRPDDRGADNTDSGP